MRRSADGSKSLGSGRIGRLQRWEWAILKQLEPQGEFSAIIWSVADFMAGRPGDLKAGTDLQKWADSALGC